MTSDGIKQYVDSHGIVLDDHMDSTSENGVQNKVIKAYVDTEAVLKNPGSGAVQEIEGGVIVDESLQVPGVLVVDQTQG